MTLVIISIHVLKFKYEAVGKLDLDQPLSSDLYLKVQYQLLFIVHSIFKSNFQLKLEEYVWEIYTSSRVLAAKIIRHARSIIHFNERNIHAQ